MTQQNDELIAEVWSVRVITTGPVIAFETGLEERAGATALALSRTDDGRNCLDAWFDLPPENALIEQIITAGKMSEYEVDWQVIHHASRDWLAENRRNFPPLTIGRFWIYGSHIQAPRPRAKYQLKVDAAQAFGSGTHPTTEGCLLALQSLAKVAPVHAMLLKGRILDMGCGSAILAMAVHR
ncbi:MAG TPA: 50S ribosomal protein L11 methyltransferase, partial [Alphaproteobacteria bacterium]|nr:50S ribosomal protein L11 methyltransferase [Alphaproteobacteria bacterium]